MGEPLPDKHSLPVDVPVGEGLLVKHRLPVGVLEILTVREPLLEGQLETLNVYDEVEHVVTVTEADDDALMLRVALPLPEGLLLACVSTRPTASAKIRQHRPEEDTIPPD